MSKLTSFFKAKAPAIKSLLNGLLSTQKPKVKAFVRAKADEYYNQLDQFSTGATIAGLGDYLQSKAGDNPLGKAVASKLKDLITAGLALGMLDMGLNAADTLTRRELDKVLSYIDKKIDGARL